MNGHTPPTQYGTALALGEDGVLIIGPSGSGKSSLALSLLEGRPDRALIADDRVALELVGKTLLASPPLEIEGLIEIRGLGILRFPWRRRVPLRLIVELAPEGSCARLPGAAEQSLRVFGQELPLLRLPIGFFGAGARIQAALALLRPGGDALLHSGVDWTKLSRREEPGEDVSSARQAEEG